MSLFDIILNFYFIAILLFLISLIFFFIAIIIKIKIIKKLCIAMFSIFITLAIIESAHSFYIYEPLTDDIIPYNDKYNYFPQKGSIQKYIYIKLDNDDEDIFLLDENYENKRKNFVGDRNIVLDVVYTIDENGLRYTESNNNSKEAYLFLGCSFIFGYCINDNETLPYLFSKEFNFEKKVINAGQDARGINRAYSILATKDYLDTLLGNSKLKYVFYEFMEDHISRAFRYGVTDDFSIYENGKNYEAEQPFRIIKKYGINSLLYNRFLYDIIEKISYPFYIKNINNTFLKMYNISKDYYDANFVVIMWDSNEDLERYFIDNNIDFIKAYEILDYENDTVKEDVFAHHPSINGNKKIVNLIMNFLKKKGEI